MKFQTKKIHLATSANKPDTMIVELNPGYRRKKRKARAYYTACGKICLRSNIRMRTNEVTCKACIATNRYQTQLAIDNKR